ncbi:MAG: hypothetical protein AAGI10_07465 [Pseudomonadota bacterium]
MKQLLLTTALVASLNAPFNGASAQNAGDTAGTVAEDQRPSGAQAFTPENAILNTAVLFAVGAREAQQSLRNAFGWPTFQEGLVHGVYFRFDPDGYARFSPSPRLDTDVFEVICRPRTYTCMARKGPLMLTLSSDGRVQIMIDQVQATDTFALNDGFSELQIPPRVNGVLDPQIEALLSGGGSLVVRRNGEVLEDISLQGFSAVHAYLLWVAARQDYTVLPRDWPVPNGLTPAPSQTPQSNAWPNLSLRSAPVLEQSAAQQLAQVSDNAQDTPEMAALRSEVSLLRDLLLAQTGGGGFPTAATMAQTPVSTTTQTPVAIQSELDTLSRSMGIAPAMLDGDGFAIEHDAFDHDHTMGMKNSGAGAMVGHEMNVDQHGMDANVDIRHLQYLTGEMHFDTRTALLILQLSHSVAAGEPVDASISSALQPSASASLFQQLSAVMANDGSTVALDAGTDPGDEYALLATYFRSVIGE